LSSTEHIIQEGRVKTNSAEAAASKLDGDDEDKA